MKHINIWHLPKDSKKQFMSIHMLKALNLGEVNPSEYMKVYSCHRPDDYTPDAAFEEFNLNHPEDYHSHSLSVSDIVEIDGKKFFCDSIGWKEV